MGRKVNLNDIIGKKIGRLSVLSFETRKESDDKRKRIFYKCQCDCGNIKIISRDNLLHNTTKSCGCYAREEKIKRASKHNLSGNRIYKIYCGIKKRCYNINSSNYKIYGGKGIKMCDIWLQDFMNFHNWAINNGYKENLTIDRIDVNGNYEPNNCRWVDMVTQANNRTKNYNITYKNQTHTASEWAKLYGFKSSTVRARLRKGYTIEEALTIPLNPYNKIKNMRNKNGNY